MATIDLKTYARVEAAQAVFDAYDFSGHNFAKGIKHGEWHEECGGYKMVREIHMADAARGQGYAEQGHFQVLFEDDGEGPGTIPMDASCSIDGRRIGTYNPPEVLDQAPVPGL